MNIGNGARTVAITSGKGGWQTFALANLAAALRIGAEGVGAGCRPGLA